jgi:hypothetical protein
LKLSLVQEGKAQYPKPRGATRGTKELKMSSLDISLLGQPAIEKLLSDRATTHGSFARNAEYSQELKRVFRSSIGWEYLDMRQREALDCVALKLSRILSSKAINIDAWIDLQGYAALAVHPDPER